MAIIEERSGRYRVYIRKKNMQISKTFKSKVDAELFVKWKEDLIDQIAAFDPPKENLIRLDEAILIKWTAAKEEGLCAASLSDILRMKDYFPEFLDKGMREITYDDMMKKANEMLNTIVYRGGSKTEKSGRPVQQSRETVRRKFKILSTVYSHLISLGFDLENHPIKISTYLFNFRD